MDLDNAAAAHSEWRTKLRGAILKRERVDAATISADNCCPLGKWLHGEATRYAKLPAYRDVVMRHAEFHMAAGAVAQQINNGAYADAEKMLDAGTTYAAASSRVGAAILGLKKAVASA